MYLSLAISGVAGTATEIRSKRMLATLFAALMYQDTVSWDLRTMFHNMGALALTVVVILFLLSICHRRAQ